MHTFMSIFYLFILFCFIIMLFLFKILLPSLKILWTFLIIFLPGFGNLRRYIIELIKLNRLVIGFHFSFKMSTQIFPFQILECQIYVSNVTFIILFTLGGLIG